MKINEIQELIGNGSKYIESLTIKHQMPESFIAEDSFMLCELSIKDSIDDMSLLSLSFADMKRFTFTGGPYRSINLSGLQILEDEALLQEGSRYRVFSENGITELSFVCSEIFLTETKQ